MKRGWLILSHDEDVNVNCPMPNVGYAVLATTTFRLHSC